MQSCLPFAARSPTWTGIAGCRIAGCMPALLLSVPFLLDPIATLLAASQVPFWVKGVCARLGVGLVVDLSALVCAHGGAMVPLAEEAVCS